MPRGNGLLDVRLDCDGSIHHRWYNKHVGGLFIILIETCYYYCITHKRRSRETDEGNLTRAHTHPPTNWTVSIMQMSSRHCLSFLSPQRLAHHVWHCIAGGFNSLLCQRLKIGLFIEKLNIIFPSSWGYISRKETRNYMRTIHLTAALLIECVCIPFSDSFLRWSLFSQWRLKLSRWREE